MWVSFRNCDPLILPLGSEIVSLLAALRITFASISRAPRRTLSRCTPEFRELVIMKRRLLGLFAGRSAHAGDARFLAAWNLFGTMWSSQHHPNLLQATRPRKEHGGVREPRLRR